MGMNERKAKITIIFEKLETNLRTAYFIAGKLELGFRASADMLNVMVAEDFLTCRQDYTTRKKFYNPTEYGLVTAKKFLSELE